MSEQRQIQYQTPAEPPDAFPCGSMQQDAESRDFSLVKLGQGGIEFQHALWIPGDPFEALKAVFVAFRPQDQEEVVKKLLLIAPS